MPKSRVTGSVARGLGVVKIAGYRIPVHIAKDLKVDGGTALGAYRYVNPAIWLNKAIHGQEYAHTLLHESLHALDKMYKIGLTERHIALLEVAIGDLIVNNPKLVKSLSGKKR